MFEMFSGVAPSFVVLMNSDVLMNSVIVHGACVLVLIYSASGHSVSVLMRQYAMSSPRLYITEDDRASPSAAKDDSKYFSKLPSCVLLSTLHVTTGRAVAV